MFFILFLYLFNVYFIIKPIYYILIKTFIILFLFKYFYINIWVKNLKPIIEIIKINICIIIRMSYPNKKHNFHINIKINKII